MNMAINRTHERLGSAFWATLLLVFVIWGTLENHDVISRYLSTRSPEAWDEVTRAALRVLLASTAGLFAAWVALRVSLRATGKSEGGD
jgi:hypothetical protein